MDLTSKLFLVALLFFLSLFLLLLSRLLRSISKSMKNQRDTTAIIYQLFHDDIAKPAQNLVTTAERIGLHKPERFSDEQWARLKDDLKSDRDRLTKQVHRLREVAMAEMLDRKDERIDVADCVAEICENFAELARSHQVELNNETTDIGLYIHANLIDLKNIISNIVENGIRYSDASKKDRFLTISAKSVLFGVSIRVKDNGIGFSSRKLKVVGREPVRESASTITGGGGVGLFLIKKMADSNNMRITIRSEVGVGTEVTISKREFLPKLRFAKRKKL